MKKSYSTLKLVFFIALMALFGVIFISGIKLSSIAGVYDIAPTQEKINYGLDLTGGVYVVLEADESSGAVTDETLDKAIATIRNRIDSMGLKEPTISKQGGDQIRISIPDISNQQEALDTIGKTAQLSFVDPNENVILTGADVVGATYEKRQDSSGLVDESVRLEFSAEGKTKFASATKEFLNQAITIKLDEEIISSPTVQSEITDGIAYITGIGKQEEAISLARLIRAGALPVAFTPVQTETIGPTLGQDSLQKSVFSGSMGVLLVLAFMLAVYRIPGIAADLALIAYMLLFLNVMAIFQVTLTLPGIAGIILSVGMAVDANVIIFERVKEELKLGKTMINAIESGFSNALSAIIDSNVTTIIAGAALFLFGTGSIRGFAMTLMIGVALSFITAMTLTRKLLMWILSSANITNPAMFGVKGINAK
jgi:preprotein translocase subunit SecD